MTQAVVTIHDGLVFQARMFWLQAARLLDHESPVVRVGFESGRRGFDDVWVEYDPKRAPQDHLGTSIVVQRMQCKWHVSPGHFSHEDLVRSEYIGATTASFLQRALAALRQDSADGMHSQLALVTNHTADPKDELTRHIRTRSLALDVEGLFAGKTARSATGRVRKLWRDHLGLSDDELRGLCVRLGFNLTRDSLESIKVALDDVCRANGLVRPKLNSSVTPYDGNVFEWAGQRRTMYDRKSFREKCEQEGLLVSQQPKSRKVFGVKSFEHPIDRLENRAEVLNFVPEFDERLILREAAWRDTLVPRLSSFLLSASAPNGRIRLAIEAHATLAFAAGAILNTKSGRLVELEQRSPNIKIWASDDEIVAPEASKWTVETHDLDRDAHGTAFAISVTRDTEAGVRRYIEEHGSKLRRLVILKPPGGPSQRAVVSGAHADALAEALANEIKRQRETSRSARERSHLFVAAPNAFAFYLGRHVQVMMPLTLYEFDFTYQSDGSYRPSLSYPEAAPDVP